VLLMLVGVSLRNDVEDAGPRRERHVLFEARNLERRLTPDRARVRGALTGDEFQQRRLAGSVSSDDRDALPRLDLQEGVVEQREMTEGDRDAVERDQRHPTNVPRTVGTTEHAELAEKVSLSDVCELRVSRRAVSGSSWRCVDRQPDSRT